MNTDKLISACIVVRNEEAVIERCLKSIREAVDEIIVVHDGPCADRTLEICRRYGAVTVEEPFIGIAEPHRALAYGMARGAWLLHIDADECLSVELAQELRAFAFNGTADLYCFLWPFTDGQRDVSAGLDHPYRACLARRSKMYYYGLPRQCFHTHGTVEKVPLYVWHRPLYNNWTWEKFKTKWLPRNRIEADYVWRAPESVPVFGENALELLREHLLAMRRRPLLMMFCVFFYHFLWQLYKGMAKKGWWGMKIAFLAALDVASVRYYVFKYRRRGAPCR